MSENRQRPDQLLRLERVHLAALSSIVTVIVTLLVAWFGYLAWTPAFVYSGMVVGLVILFHMLIASGFNLRFADPSLTVPQIVAAGLATTYVVFECYQARPAFVVFYLSAFIFGVFTLDTRRLALIAVFYLACYATAAGLAVSLRPEVTEPAREVFRFIVFAVLLAGLTVMGSYIGGLRRQLGKAKTEVARVLREQRGVFDTAMVGIARLQGRTIVDCNTHFLRMFGYTKEEAIGNTTRILYADDAAWEKAGLDYYDALQGGGTLRNELTMRTKGGETIVCDVAVDNLVPGDSSQGTVVMLTDITRIKNQEAELRVALLEHMALYHNAPAAIVTVRGRVVEDCNDYMTKLVGAPREEIVGHTGERWLISRDRSEARRREFAAAFARGESYEYVEEYQRADGSHFWCKVRGGAIDPANPADGQAIFVMVDITEQKRAETAVQQSREQLVQVIRASQSGIWDYDMESGDISFSARFYEILGFPASTDPNIIMPITQRLHPEDAASVLQAFREHLKTRARLDCEFRLQRRDESYIWVRGFGQATWNPEGRAVRLVGSILDIAERKAREDEIHYLAMHDALTGLPNRRLLEDRLDHALVAARRGGETLAVMLLDLDGFKSINDSHGHETGDRVLREVARRLRSAVRESDTVARTGGDEFVILLEGTGREEGAAVLAEKILASVPAPIDIGEKHFQVGVSIGIALYPRDSDHPARLMRMADAAMYAVKDAGRNAYRFHTS